MTSAQGQQALTDEWVETALEFSASKTFSGDVERARQAVEQGRCDVCDYLRHSLARQIAIYLGQTDHTVKAVYLLEAEESLDFDDDDADAAVQPAGISLIAWVERKTEALTALAKTLEASLVASRRELGCLKATPACYFLDLHLVDDADVQKRRGYGVLLQSFHVEPMKVWARPVH